MPPWHIDRTVGIQKFKNDRSLTEGGGGFQCCWTSVHVRVTVRPAVQTTGNN